MPIRQSRSTHPAAALLLFSSLPALAQATANQPTNQPSTDAAASPASFTDPAESLVRLQETNLTLNLQSVTLAEVFDYLESATGAHLDPWPDTDEHPFDQTTRIDLAARDQPAIRVLEEALARAQRSMRGTQLAWQQSPFGSIEIAPKSALNTQPTTEMYSLGDLVIEFPEYKWTWERGYETFDLRERLRELRANRSTTELRLSARRTLDRQSALRQMFEADPYHEYDVDEAAKRTRADEIEYLITTHIETRQWEDPNLVITYNDEAKAFTITAPPYIHRQIGDYHAPKRNRIETETRQRLTKDNAKPSSEAAQPTNE